MNRKRDSSGLSEDSSGIPDKSPRARSSSSGESDSDEPIEVEVDMDDDSETSGQENSGGGGAAGDQVNQVGDMPEVDQPDKNLKSYAEATIKKPKLLVYTSEFAQTPVRFQAFLEFRKILASRFAKAVIEKTISSEINCDQIFFDRERGNAVVTCDNQESVVWLKRVISSIKVENVHFRAWEEGEAPKKFEMRLFLPDTYQQVEVEEVKAVVLHFNPGAVDTFEVKKEVALKSGRLLEVEVGPVFFQYCRANKGKIRFMMGPLDCTPPLLYREVRKTPEHQNPNARNELPSQVKPKQGGTPQREFKKSPAVEGFPKRGKEQNPGRNLSKLDSRNSHSIGVKHQGSNGTRAQKVVGFEDGEKFSRPNGANLESSPEEGEDQDKIGSVAGTDGWQKVQRKKH